jgi:hypothetical protein|tara:strand:- start:243 stop:446 length:204 start_codon:yes stop_codon:yes gene_type:complete
MARHYGIPKNHRPGNRLERLRGQASTEQTDEIEPAQGSHPERFKVTLEFIGWFAFMLMMTSVYIVFG